MPIVTKDPQFLDGYRASVWYQPEKFLYKRFRLLFDTSFSHWWVSNNSPNKSINIYSASPVLQYYLIQKHFFSYFLIVSIGLSYLTKTHLDHQNLGMHFAFQDQVGFGIHFGVKKSFTMSLTALHYSNGSLCKMNAGITVPLMLNVEYAFA